MRLIDSVSTTPAMAEVFSDLSLLQAMLDFEAALARAEARTGVIPASAAEAITQVARAAAPAEEFDAGKLTKESLRAGTLSIPLVKALTDRVRAVDEQSARFVHWGATSQDVADTAIVLLLRRASRVLAADHTRLQHALRRLSEEHSATVMLGRTLLQPAPPVTFGLKAAGWFGALLRGWTRLETAFQDAMILEFGGASGTLAALGEHGVAVGAALAGELKIRNPEAPWHAFRDRLAAVICACGIYTGSLAKMARDIALLMQGEVGEVAEAGSEARGGSSTMPHKRNPTGCLLTLAAANRVPGLVGSFLSGMAQEHERGAGGWQAEWTTIARVMEDTALSLASMTEVAEGLRVDVSRMRANLDRTRGLVFAERAMILLGAALGRDAAHTLLEHATERTIETGRTLVDVIAELPEAARVLSKEQIHNLDVPEAYLGSAEVFRQQLLAP
jgi:3-carboxy-cis,cis-muconate cycloisomerase